MKELQYLNKPAPTEKTLIGIYYDYSENIFFVHAAFGKKLNIYKTPMGIFPNYLFLNIALIIAASLVSAFHLRQKYHDIL